VGLINMYRLINIDMIENRTPYLGKIKIKFEKDPYYSGSSILNKIHINLGFTRVVSRMYPKRSKDSGYLIDPNKLMLIEKYTGGKIGEYHVDKGEPKDEFTLYNSFLSKDGVYIDDIKRAWWYYMNNMTVCNKYPSGVAGVNNKDRTELIGYYGYTHRGGQSFKIGDKIFDENYIPKEKDYPDWEWAGFESARLVSENKQIQDGWIKNFGETDIADYIPFVRRGKKTIKTLDEAMEAAHNMSMYLS
jgi:hypothetical protein